MIYINIKMALTKKICLNMIVKNEAHIILETLNNIKKYIDYWVISDTGSTDGTQDLIKNFFKEANIDGELLSHEWKDFGYNRSKALEACYEKSDYIWVIDADDIVVGDLKFPDNMDADIYNLKYGDSFTYDRGQVFKNRGLKWEYRGILHEFPICINKKDVKHGKLVGNYYIDSRRLGARSQVADKYQRDAKLLSEHIEKYPKDELTSRYCFYAGQSYFDCHDYENSMKYYKKRIELKGWYEEVYFSLNRIANCLLRLNKPEKVIVAAFIEGHKYLPSRAEPLYELGEYYLSKQNFVRANQCLEKAISIPFPQNQILFLHKDVYEWRAKYAYLTSLVGLNKYKEAYNLADNYHLNYISNWNRFEMLKMSYVPHIADEYINYDKKRVDVIAKYLETNKKNNLTFTITTCKRFDLFEKTMNSFINCCNDILSIDRWILVDDNSSQEDRTKMKELYPFIEFIFKTPEQKGHAISMNMIRTMIKTPYVLHMEDDWKFFVKKNYIKPAIEILIRNEINPIDDIPSDQNIKNKKIAQVLFNKNYTVVHDRPVLGGYLAKTNNDIKFRIHEHYKPGTDGYENAVGKYRGGTCIYWPHYSLQPSIMSTKIYEELGPYPDKGFFERLYADKYIAANYISVFYDTFTCIHIGKQTWDKSTDTKNAYALNNVSQFDLNNPNSTSNSDTNNLTKNNCTFNDYTFYQNKDSMSNDISYVANKSIDELKILADTDDNCVAFNTYGYLKFKVNATAQFINLPNKFYNNDGLYVKNTPTPTTPLHVSNEKIPQNEPSTQNSDNIINNFINDCVVERPPLQRVEQNLSDSVPNCGSDNASIFDDQLNNYSDNNFTFHQGLDIIGYDISLNKLSINEMKQIALNDDKCVGFNTLGYFKHTIHKLVKPHIFSTYDGIFLKKLSTNLTMFEHINKLSDKLSDKPSDKLLDKPSDKLLDKPSDKPSDKTINIITTELIKSIAENMKCLLKDLEYNVNINYQLTAEDKTKDNIYIIIADKIDINMLPKKYILYQVEQSTSPWFTDDYLKIISNSKFVWDFSLNNKMKYSHLNKNTCYMPMPYYINKDIYNNNTNTKFDILFYGACNRRRDIIINNIVKRKKYKVRIAYDICGEERDTLIKQSKIIINLHYYNNAALETCRINEVLKFNKLVISEKPSINDDFNKQLYDNLVVFFDVIQDDFSNMNQLYTILDQYIDDNNYNEQIIKINNNLSSLHAISEKYIKKNINIFENNQEPDVNFY